MDATNAILNSLIQTKSVERVLSPISSKVSQLIIQNEAYERGDRSAFPGDLTASAMEVMKCSQKLVDAGSSLISTSSDEVLQNQMPRACESLSVAGQTLVTAAQRINIENLSPESRSHLVSCAKYLLEATLKVLLVSDESEVRRIVLTGQCVIDRIAVLTAVRNMKDLVPVFKSITDSVMLLTEMAGRRQSDLTHSHQREAVLVAMTSLRRTLPMLSSAMQTFIKFPEAAQAVSSKDYAVGQMVESVHDLIAALENKQESRCSLEEVEEPGYFLITVDRIIERLSGDNGQTDMNELIDSAVRHCMSVAQLCQFPELKSGLIDNCHKVLKCRSKLDDICKSLSTDPELPQAAQELQDSREELTQHIQTLEKTVGECVLQLVVSECKETTEPLERLVKAAMSIYSRNVESPSESSALLKPYIDAFHMHTDNVCQVTRFLAAACSHPKLVRSLRCSVNQLERLDPELVPAILAVATSGQDRGKDAATEHLRMVKKEWVSNEELLICHIDDVIDKQLFLIATENQLRGEVNQCKSSIYTELKDITDVTRSVIGLGRRFMVVAQKVSDHLDDVVQRNAVRTSLKQLKKVLKVTKSAASRLLGDTGELRYHETLHARCDVLLQSITQVKYKLSGEGNRHQTELNGLADLHIDDDAEEDQDHFGEDLAEQQQEDINRISTPGCGEKMKLGRYIAELRNDRIQQLSQAFVTSAVAGEKQQVDLLGNDLLKYTNHVSETAAAVSNSSVKDKQMLTEVSCIMKSEAADLLKLSSQVLACEVQHIEELHKTADSWCNHVSYLMTHVDSLIDRWKDVSDRVVDAAKLGNVQLVTAQMLHLREHQKFILRLITSARELITSNNLNTSSTNQPLLAGNEGSQQQHYLYSVEWGNVLEDFGLELENLTVLLSTQADSLVKLKSEDYRLELENLTVLLSTQADSLVKLKSDSSYEKTHIEMTSRDWAAKAYVIISTVTTLSIRNIATATRVETTVETSIMDVSWAEKCVSRLRADTVRVKQLVQYFCDSNSAAAMGVIGKVEDLDTVLSNMTEQLELLNNVAVSEHQLQHFYAPYHLLMLQWTWTCKVNSILNTIDGATGDFSVLPQLLLQSDHANESDTTSMCDMFNERLSSIKTSVHSAIEASNAMDQKQAVWALLSELDSVHQQITTFSSSEKSEPERSSNKTLLLAILTREWSITAEQLLYQLHSFNTSKKPAISEVEKLLKGHPDPSKSSLVHNVLHSNTTPQTDRRQQHNQTTTPSAKNENRTSDKKSHSAHSYTPDTPVRSAPNPSWQQLAQGAKMQHSTPIRPTDQSRFKPSNLGGKVNQHTFTGWAVEAERWEDEHNTIVRVARETAYQVKNMTAYLKGEGNLQSKYELIETAKTVAVNGEKLVKFARILVDYSTDKICASDLNSYCQQLPTIIAQLHIMSRVKEESAQDFDHGAERMLLKMAQNLVSGVNKMLCVAEAVCIKGLREPPSAAALDETEALILATQWKRRFNQHRQVQTTNAHKDSLGLRKVNHHVTTPALAQIIQ